jgi:type IV secretory pathway VirB3-like protein
LAAVLVAAAMVEQMLLPAVLAVAVHLINRVAQEHQDKVILVAQVEVDREQVAVVLVL